MAQMDSIVFYRSFFEALQVFQDAGERAQMYDAILSYAFNGTEPTSLSPMQTAIYTLIKPQLDANVRKSENGKKGGRPKKETNDSEKNLGIKNKKPLVFENENHSFSETESNKNKNINKNSNKNINVNSNKNACFADDNNIPDFDTCIDYLTTKLFLTNTEATDVLKSFIDYNAKRDWSSLKTRTWQSLLSQFMRNDKRFTDDVLSERKAKAVRKAEEERRQKEEAERYQDKSLYLETAEDFIDYVRNGKPFSKEEEVLKVAIGYIFNDAELSELWNDQPVYIDESYGNAMCQFINYDFNYGIKGFDSFMFDNLETPLAKKVRENFMFDDTPNNKTYKAIEHLLPDDQDQEPEDLPFQ